MVELVLLQKNPDASENEGKVIKYLISAPTMRVPQNVADTTNAYLAFRAVLRAGYFSDHLELAVAKVANY
jgi:hypothetical protein